jgi:GTP-binding protein
MVGCVEYEDYLQISIADLPGLLPDLTSGFGTRYLHHLERCKIIIFVLDFSKSSEEILNNENYEPFRQYLNMKNVLDSYDRDLLINKSSIIIAHKIDKLLLDRSIDEKVNEFKTKLLQFFKTERLDLHLPSIIPVSAKDKINLNKFLKLLRKTYEYENISGK